MDNCFIPYAAAAAWFDGRFLHQSLCRRAELYSSRFLRIYPSINLLEYLWS